MKMFGIRYTDQLRSPGKALATLLISLALLFARPVLAEGESSLSLHGFGTLGAVQTTSSNVEFVRDLAQPRGANEKLDTRVDSILGVQANWRLTPDLEAVVQADSRYRYDRSFNPEISWAYVKYDPTPQVSLRAGRLGTEFFMTADSRLVGYSYLSVRPPGDFFWYLPFYSINGIDAALTVPVGDDVLRGKVYYGIADGKIPYGEKQWDIEGSPMVGGYLDYQMGSWLMRASYANIRFSRDMPINDILAFAVSRGYPLSRVGPASDYLSADGTRSHYYSLGAIYDNGPWQVQIMFNKITQGAKIFESSSAAYVLAGYRFGEVTPYLGFSWIASEARKNPPDTVLATIMAKSHADQHTGILGVRWDVARNIALKAQWDAIRGEPKSTFPYRAETSNWSGKMDVFSVTMDFVF